MWKYYLEIIHSPSSDCQYQNAQLLYLVVYALQNEKLNAALNIAVKCSMCAKSNQLWWAEILMNSILTESIF